MKLEQMLRIMSEAGGEIEAVENAFAPHSREAERLGLITIELAGGGWGDTEILRLTNKGRRETGLPAITPTTGIPFPSKLMAAMRLPKRIFGRS